MAVRKIRLRTRGSLQKNKMLKSNNKKQHTEVKVKNQKTLVIAQEIKFARLLANNDKKVRDKVLKNLKKWLIVRSQSSFAFTETDFMSLWKGLFYCMWMSDKMLIQEELAESLSKLVHCFNSKDTIVLYTSCTLKTLAIEWFGIDQYRLDKFSMLVRRILRQTFVVCKDRSWDIEWVKEISQIFEKLFLHPKTGLGFSLHITEIYLEELAKISGGNLPKGIINELIKPFVIYLITTKDERQMKHIMRHIFRYLIFQSDIGIDYIEKFEAWRAAGFPSTHVDDMQKVEISDNEENSENEEFSETETQNATDKVLDPRAGRVNVELPQISFNAAEIVQLLSQYKFYPTSTAKSRRQLSRLLEEFKELSNGTMPLGIKRVRKAKKGKDMNSTKAARRLIRFEKGLFSDKVNKKRKRNQIEIDACSTSLDSTQNGDISDLDLNENGEKTIDSQSKSIGLTGMTTKSNLLKTDASVVPFKKRKKSNLKFNELSNKQEMTKGQVDKKKKLGTKSLNKKSSKVKKLRLEHTNDAQIGDKNIKHKTKKAMFNKKQVVFDNIDPCTSSALISQNNSLPKKITRNKLVVEKTILANGVTSSDQIKPLKNKYTSRMKEQTNLNISSATKKKVKIMLNRNTAQHTSEYIQQVRKSPSIPFDANKKPLVGVLKSSPISSPINPFYRKALRS